jgi:hypothetical protein
MNATPLSVFTTTFPDPMTKDVMASFVSYRPFARPDFTAHHSMMTDNVKIGANQVVIGGNSGIFEKSYLAAA